MKKNKLFIGALALVMSVVTACSSKTQNTITTSQDKDTFTYAISDDPSSTNPIKVSDRWGLTMTNIIYSPLIKVNGDGSKEYALAESTELAKDGLSLKVNLRKDVKWSDGQKFTADDVVFTYQTKAKKENGNFKNLWIGDKPITVEKVDDYTVVFKFPEPSAAAANNIANETYIIPKHVYGNVSDFSVKELKETPVGTGPYKLVENKRGEYIKFEANENYYNGKPKVKNVVLRIIKSADTTKVALQKGEVDAAYVLPAAIKDLDSKNIDTYPYSENRIGYLGLNTNTDELKDVKVRQAILYALNKEDMNKAAYLDSKYYQNPYSFLPPKNPFHTDDVEKYTQNVEKAKSLLKEAGVSNLKLNLGYASNDAANTIQATFIQQQLQSVGINVELRGGDETAIFTELRKPGSKAYNLFLGGYIMGNDPDLYSKLFGSNGTSNYFQYRSEKVDGLFKQGAAELDETKRKEVYKNLQQEVANQAYLYPIVDNQKILAVNKRVGNVNDAKLVPIYTFDDLSKITLK